MIGWSPCNSLCWCNDEDDCRHAPKNNPPPKTEHTVWINDWKVEDRETRGYRRVLGAEGQEIERGGTGIRQVLMSIPVAEYEAIINRDICPDSAYNDHIPDVSYEAFKPQGWPCNLIAESPQTDADEHNTFWANKHPVFAWVSPGNVLRGHTNWFWNGKFCRFVYRNFNSGWTLYIRMVWSPKFKFDFVPETIGQAAGAWR